MKSDSNFVLQKAGLKKLLGRSFWLLLIAYGQQMTIMPHSFPKNYYLFDHSCDHTDEPSILISAFTFPNAPTHTSGLQRRKETKQHREDQQQSNEISCFLTAPMTSKTTKHTGWASSVTIILMWVTIGKLSFVSIFISEKSNLFLWVLCKMIFVLWILKN